MADIKKAFSYLLIAALILLWVSLIWLLWKAYQGDISVPLVSAASSFALVTVTIYYAWQSRRSVQSTEATLDEMRKDRQKHGKILTIAFGIDAIKSDLDRYREKWESLDEGSCPQLGHGWEFPDEQVLNDIEEVYPRPVATLDHISRNSMNTKRGDSS